MDGTQLPGDEERNMLREAVRVLLAQHWPADKALAFAADTARLRGIWSILGEQGYAALGTDPAAGGLREILVVMSELGRAACPAPMIDAALLNLLLGGEGQARDFLSDLQGGHAFACLSFAGADPDPAAGRITGANGKFGGTVNFVETAACATHFAFLEGDGTALVIAPMGDSISMAPARAMGADGQYRVDLHDTTGLVVPLSRARVADMLAVSRLCHAARAWGAASRAFELAVDYARLRKQFGQ